LISVCSPVGSRTLIKLVALISVGGLNKVDFSDVWCVLLSGWLWYYRRYIDVKKGGVGGLSMLLAGYCVLSYVWSYPHLSDIICSIKLLFNRWR
uniref:Uncharacterized protein n=1 Tax=Cyprinodon variegatus TaxID=28743 RepID=A0A3Q2FVN1_CYPVA